MRNPAEISKKSAASIAKWRIKEVLETDKSIDPLTRIGMKQALMDGGGVDQIANILYDLGLKISVDRNNKEHADWIKDGAVEIEKN